MLLTRLWTMQDWDNFASLFKIVYDKADEAGKLKLIRALLSKWLDTRALSAVLIELPELKVTYMADIL